MPAEAARPPLVLSIHTGKENTMTEQEKPLDKMTAKELREVAKEIPEITGVHGMVKADLLSAIKAARGIVDDTPARPSKAAGNIKGAIRDLKKARRTALEAKDGKMATIYKRRISRLKKKSRKAAATV